MEEDGCRETVIREIVEDKESKGRERGGQAGRKGDRKYLVCLKKGMGEVKSTGRQTKRDKQPTCSL